MFYVGLDIRLSVGWACHETGGVQGRGKPLVFRHVHGRVHGGTREDFLAAEAENRAGEYLLGP
jgi:hypothetical protein